MKKDQDNKKYQNVNQLINYFGYTMIHDEEIPVTTSIAILKRIEKVLGMKPETLINKLNEYYVENEYDIKEDISNCNF